MDCVQGSAFREMVLGLATTQREAAGINGGSANRYIASADVEKSRLYTCVSPSFRCIHENLRMTHLLSACVLCVLVQ